MIAQLLTVSNRVGRYCKIELQIPRDVSPIGIGADIPKATRIACRLRCNHHSLRQSVAEQPSQLAVAAGGLGRYAGAREHERHSALAALVIQVGPQLGFENHRQPRMNAIEEALHGARQVERNVAHPHPILEHRTRSGGPCGCQCRHDERNIWKVLPQRSHERRGRLHLSDGHRVDPDTGTIQPRPEAETLAEVAPVTAILQSAAQHQQRDQGCGYVDGQGVCESQGVAVSEDAVNE